ncbi:hypothetical protein H5410_039323 [Solanum commersonii]|uniref:Uncharacterized protein n=1 Tax=Solanum commersonii TaxID=4109 RepID=A0A9J5YBJ7_SOLCO|nr:hypothetical protein H5410_039323 [Solanum commersonii]
MTTDFGDPKFIHKFAPGAKKTAKLDTEVADLKDYKRSDGITMNFHKWRPSFSQFNVYGEPENAALKCNVVVNLVKETSSNRGWRLLL